MATLYIAELANLGRPARGGPDMQVAEVPPVAEQTVAIGGASVQSAQLNVNTRFVRLCADTVCSVAFGGNPTATTSNLRLPANTPEYFSVETIAGSRLIAVIANT